MEKKRQIYCIEGVHDWGDGQIEPTVEPMLELLKRTGSWDYLHRTCATLAELEYRLKKEWHECCEKGSVLYFFTHGRADQVWLSEKVVGVITLKDWLYDCEGCHIHFGGCATFSRNSDNLKRLMAETNATSVSGYATDVFWLGREKPALALELQLFWLLKEMNLGRNQNSRPRKLREIRDYLQRTFRDCEFNMEVSRFRKTR